MDFKFLIFTEIFIYEKNSDGRLAKSVLQDKE